jgi:hypothetical protein
MCLNSVWSWSLEKWGGLGPHGSRTIGEKKVRSDDQCKVTHCKTETYISDWTYMFCSQILPRDEGTSLLCQGQRHSRLSSTVYIYESVSNNPKKSRCKLILLFPTKQGTTGHPKAVLTSHKVQVNNSYFFGKRVHEKNVKVSTTYLKIYIWIIYDSV